MISYIDPEFASFQSMLHFMKSKCDVTSSFLMKLSFSQNQIFSKKQNLYASFFLVLCLRLFVVDIMYITLLLSQIYVCTTSYRLSDRKWWHQQEGQHIFEIYVKNVTKLIKLLCPKFYVNWTNIKQTNIKPNLLGLTQKRPFLVGSLSWQVWN